MADASELYMRRHAERMQAEAERAKMRGRLRAELDKGTPRAMRARLHGNMALAIFTKFIPDACRAEAFEEAMLNFFAQDYEIVLVPPERDVQAAIELRKAMTTITPTLIFPRDDQK